MRFSAAFGLVAALGGGCVDPAQEAAREKLICTASPDTLTEVGRVGLILGEYDCYGAGADSLVCLAATDLHDALTRAQNDLSLPKASLAHQLKSRCGSMGSEAIAAR